MELPAPPPPQGPQLLMMQASPPVLGKGVSLFGPQLVTSRPKSIVWGLWGPVAMLFKGPVFLPVCTNVTRMKEMIIQL